MLATGFPGIIAPPTIWMRNCSEGRYPTVAYSVPRMGTNTAEKMIAMMKPHHGRPDFAAYASPSPSANVIAKSTRNHQMGTSLYTFIFW